jgi:hypothetical protein
VLASRLITTPSDEGTKRAAVHGRACERRPHEFVRSEDERNRGRPRQRTGGGTRP